MWCVTKRRRYASSEHLSITGVHRNKCDKKWNDRTTIWSGSGAKYDREANGESL